MVCLLKNDSSFGCESFKGKGLADLSFDLVLAPSTASNFLLDLYKHKAICSPSIQYQMLKDPEPDKIG